MNITESINELVLFSPDILTLENPCNINDIHKFEEISNWRLPNDYKIFLQRYNGVNLYGSLIYGIEFEKKSFSLPECYHFEHFEAGNPMPLYLIPFSPDGGGNHYCFDSRFNDDISCPVVFWQHDVDYSKGEDTEITHHDFAGFIKEVLIDWTLEDYNYDGTEREV